MNRLSEDFLIGAATSAHQVEGNNIHSDYWAMEQMENTSFQEPSLEAVDHYNRYREDIKLLAENGLNAYRFSVEWARIEPEPGGYDKKEIAHYRDMLICCRENGVEPIVTMHHFSSPKWLIEQGGWEEEATIEKFAGYCGYVTEQLGDLMNYVCTINEANMGLQIAAIAERYKNQILTQDSGNKKKHAESSVQVGINLEVSPMAEKMKRQVMENIRIFGTPQPQVFVGQRTKEGDILVMRAHQAAKEAIRAVRPELKVGITLSLHDIQPMKGGEQEAKRVWAEEFLHYVPYIKEDDFLGVQNYTRMLIGQEGTLPCPKGAEMTQMGYEFYPQALENVIRTVHDSLDLPIIVTENGIATADDSRRIVFIREALKGAESCIADGIPVLGYLYWSLLDNFEWQKGFSMTFGLIGVDRKTQKRYPKESLKELASYLKGGSL